MKFNINYRCSFCGNLDAITVYFQKTVNIILVVVLTIFLIKGKEPFKANKLKWCFIFFACE